MWSYYCISVLHHFESKNEIFLDDLLNFNLRRLVRRTMNLRSTCTHYYRLRYRDPLFKNEKNYRIISRSSCITYRTARVIKAGKRSEELFGVLIISDKCVCDAWRNMGFYRSLIKYLSHKSERNFSIGWK